MKRVVVIYLFLFSQLSSAKGQKVDSLANREHKNKKAVVKAFAIPTSLIALGIYGTTDNGFINHNEIREERNEYFPGFSNKADNYLQFAPIVTVYTMDA